MVWAPVLYENSPQLSGWVGGSNALMRLPCRAWACCLRYLSSRAAKVALAQFQAFQDRQRWCSPGCQDLQFEHVLCMLSFGGFRFPALRMERGSSAYYSV